MTGEKSQGVVTKLMNDDPDPPSGDTDDKTARTSEGDSDAPPATQGEAGGQPSLDLDSFENLYNPAATERSAEKEESDDDDSDDTDSTGDDGETGASDEETDDGDETDAGDSHDSDDDDDLFVDPDDDDDEGEGDTDGDADADELTDEDRELGKRAQKRIKGLIDEVKRLREDQGLLDDITVIQEETGLSDDNIAQGLLILGEVRKGNAEAIPVLQGMVEHLAKVTRTALPGSLPEMRDDVELPPDLKDAVEMQHIDEAKAKRLAALDAWYDAAQKEETANPPQAEPQSDPQQEAARRQQTIKDLNGEIDRWLTVDQSVPEKKLQRARQLIVEKMGDISQIPISGWLYKAQSAWHEIKADRANAKRNKRPANSPPPMRNSNRRSNRRSSDPTSFEDIFEDIRTASAP